MELDTAHKSRLWDDEENLKKDQQEKNDTSDDSNAFPK